jgi:hypothetical protein
MLKRCGKTSYMLYDLLRMTAVVWMNVPQGPGIKDLVPRVVLLGGAVNLYKVGPYGRSLGHWGHASKKNCRTCSILSFCFLVCEM